MEKRSYKVVKQNLAGQRRQVVANGLSEEQAYERAAQFESENDFDERRGNSLQVEYVVEKG